MRWLINLFKTLICVLSCFICGCVSPHVVMIRQDCSEKIWRGVGIIVDTNKIMTAWHVVKRNNGDTIVEVDVWFRRNVPCHLVRIIACGAKEPIVVLSPDDDYRFPKERVIKVSNGEDTTPYSILTMRGTFLWDDYEPEKGDSGSAVVNKNNELIGVIYAQIDGTPRMLRIAGRWGTNEE